MLTLERIDKTLPVLLVEDDSYTALDIEQMLVELGFETVLVCLTYGEAAEKVAQGGFGLSIFDINVGGMLSFGLISKAVALGQPVVTISGYTTSAEAFEGRIFLAKPVKPAGLASAIVKAQNLCDMRKAG